MNQYTKMFQSMCNKWSKTEEWSRVVVYSYNPSCLGGRMIIV